MQLTVFGPSIVTDVSTVSYIGVVGDSSLFLFFVDMIVESGQHNCYSDWTTSWTIRGSDPGRRNKLFFFINLQTGCRAHAASYSVVPSFFSQGWSHQIINLANYLYLERDLSMSGTVPPRPYVSS